MIDRISQLLNSRWLINQEIAISYLPALFAFMNGQRIDFSASESQRLKPYFLSAKDGSINTSTKYDIQSDQALSNSVAVIPIQSEILAWRSMELVSLISSIEENPNIIAIVFLVNSPGGMVFYTDIASACIASMTKPNVAFVMNMAASAAMWMISGCNRIIASSPMDRFGSIGAMASILDYAKFLKEKLGIDMFEIYADKSIAKNINIRNLLNGDLTMEERTLAIREDLNFVNEFFHSAIQNNLGISPDSEVFTGQIYNAETAIQLGLAHEINTFEYAVNLAYSSGLKHSIHSFIHSNS
ncbi:MAG: S49 family peptidase [Bacteroidota bacterium]